ncbi:MAG: Na/Pi symporter [Candidatus Gygaella obscura]|nr:Na/Pi symporter [Candidatus Gygaella obscura]
MKNAFKRNFRILSVITLLYLFLVSIKLIGSSFKMFGSGFAENLICSCSNPIVGLFIGILTTSIIQSSSTTTSLVVGFVGGGMLPLDYAIPIIMGANIGTTITNSLVSLSFVTRREDFRRAFSGATMHDFFNLCSVILFLPLELKFHFLQRSAIFLTKIFETVGGVKLTSPLKLIIDPVIGIIKHFLKDIINTPDMLCGIIMFSVSVFVMIFSLVYIVKVMRSLVISKTEGFIHKYLFRNDATAFILALSLTAIMQSSSVTTALVVPLIGSGILTVYRAYPYVLGANLGTTLTALLASLATVSIVNGKAVNTIGITAAFAHFMFNICGIAVFYPLRKIPIYFSTKISDLAYRKRRWALIYVLGFFIIIPLAVIFFIR